MLERYKYDVALSFAGEQREYVEEVWSHLLKDSNLNVFYDNSVEIQAKHLGERFSKVAQTVYGKTSTFVVIFTSNDYINKAWPHLEAAYILDRMRQALFSEGNVFIGKFDDSDLPGFPSDIWYTDLRKNTPHEFSEILKRAIQKRCCVDRNNILLMMGQNRFQEVIQALEKYLLKRLVPQDQIYVYYNLACARSRLSEQDTSARDTLLSQAVSNIKKSLELSKQTKPDSLRDMLEFVNKDDDLLPLRIGKEGQLHSIFNALVHFKVTINNKRTGGNYVGGSGGCVDPNTCIRTPTGVIAIKDLDIGSPVLCMALDEPQQVQATVVINKRLYSNEKRYTINGKLVTSSSQPLFEREIGWCRASELSIGMEILKDDGSFEVIVSFVELSKGQVMIIEVEDMSHTFIANGFVCHNEGMK